MKTLRTVAASALAALSLSAQAVTLQADGLWNEFAHNEAGSPIYELFSQDTAFTFTLAQGGILRVVDAGFSGDSFEIFANGVSLGHTSQAVANAVDQVFDPDSAWSNSRYSRGSWSLAAGIYSVTGIATASPFCGMADCGMGYLSVTAVPEPGPLAMLLAGLGCIAAIARRNGRRS